MKKLCTPLLLLWFVFMAGCQQNASRQDPYRLGAGKQLYDQGQYKKAEETLSHFILANKSDQATMCEAYYLRGLCRRQIATSDTAAEKDFAKAIGRSCHPMIKGLAHVGLGHIHFERGMTALAQAKFQYLEALKYLEDREPKDAVLYRLGVTLQRMGNWLQADSYLQKCVKTFPTSSFAEPARRRTGAKVFRLQVGAFSDLNRARKKIAGLQRSGWSFDSTPQTVNNQTLYFVRSGRYSNYQRAYGQLQKLIANESEAMIVVSH